MARPNQTSYTFALIAAVAGLTACGGSSTTILEREPIVDDSDDHYEHDESARLLIAEFESNRVYVFERQKILVSQSSILRARRLHSMPQLHSVTG